MALASRYKPTLRAIDNQSSGNRGTKTVRMANSSTHRVGGFIDPHTGTNGAQTFTADQPIRGVVEDILTFRDGGYQSVFDAKIVPGTLTLPTNTTPGIYATTASNVTASFPDLLVYSDIQAGDVLTVFLTVAGGTLSTRGTTSASAVLNNFIEPNPSHSHTLLETTANATATGLQFQIVGFQASTNTVDVKLKNANGTI